MLKIYKAKKFIRVLEEGGHTKPWLIEVESEAQMRVVMKLYTTTQIESRNSVTAEVIGNILAKEFDFSVPEILFVQTTSNFFETIENEELKNTLLQTDERLKFASVYIDSATKLEFGLELDFLETNINLENLYAFDNFIRNGDRGERKTNMIIQTETAEIFLIDHEMAFDLNEETISNFQKKKWEGKFSTYHFANSYLKEKQNVDFYEFEEYIKTLNLNNLTPYFQQLEDLGFDTQEDLITEYLLHIKQNFTNFITLLKMTI